MLPKLKHIVLIHESRDRWIHDRIVDGWNEEDAKVASYWLMADEDMPALAEKIYTASPNCDVLVYEINELDNFLSWVSGRDHSSIIVWNVSDGVKRFKGSLIPALARLIRIPYFGNPVPAQSMAQDRFKLCSVARDADVPVPRCFLARGQRVVSADDTVFEAPRYFVKTNSYGNKVGLRLNAIAPTMEAALDGAKTILVHFNDDTAIQEYVEGTEIRASYIRGQNGTRFSLCHVGFYDQHGHSLPFYQITPDGYWGEEEFTPLEELERFTKEEVSRIYADVGRSVDILTASLGLRDFWAMDFRLDKAGHPLLIDLNTGAFPKGEAFENHARSVHGLGFGEALVQALHLSHAESVTRVPEE